MLRWHLVSSVSYISKREDTATGVAQHRTWGRRCHGHGSPQALPLLSPLPSTPTLQLPFEATAEPGGQAPLYLWPRQPSTEYFSHPKVRFPSGSASKESACDAGDSGLTRESRRSPGEGYGSPLQYSCLGNPIDRRAWQATAHGVQKSWTRLSTRTHKVGWSPSPCRSVFGPISCYSLISPSPEQQMLGASGVGHRARHFLQSPVSPRPWVELKSTRLLAPGGSPGILLCSQLLLVHCRARGCWARARAQPTGSSQRHPRVSLRKPGGPRPGPAGCAPPWLHPLVETPFGSLSRQDTYPAYGEGAYPASRVPTPHRTCWGNTNTVFWRKAGRAAWGWTPSAHTRRLLEDEEGRGAR